MRGWWALGLAVSLVAAPPDAEAKANRYLKRAKAAYENLDYTRVTPLLNRALKAATTAEDKIEIHYLMATMHTIYSRDRMAVEAFAQVLELDPAFELPPDTSPKIRTAFAAAPTMAQTHHLLYHGSLRSLPRGGSSSAEPNSAASVS